MKKHNYAYRDMAYPWNIITDIFGEETAAAIRNGTEDHDDIIRGLEHAIRLLKDRYIQMLNERYIDSMTFRMIAGRHGITPNRAAQIVRKSLRILRHPSNAGYIRNGYRAETERIKAEKQREKERLEEIRRESREPEAAFPDDIHTIDSLNLSVRSFNALYRKGFRDTQDVIDYAIRHKGLSGIRNMGVKSIHEIEDAFMIRGLITERIFSRKE